MICNSRDINADAALPTGSKMRSNRIPEILNEIMIYKNYNFLSFFISDFRMMFNLEDDIKFIKI